MVIVRLAELRLAALEERIDADLANGRHADVVGELDARIVDRPLRQRVRAQLTLGLDRSGRQAAALHAYRAAPRELAEERGLEPGEQLPRFERAIVLDAIGSRVAAAAPAPTVVGCGAGQAGLASDDPGTRLRWLLTGAGS